MLESRRMDTVFRGLGWRASKYVIAINCDIHAEFLCQSGEGLERIAPLIDGRNSSMSAVLQNPSGLGHTRYSTTRESWPSLLQVLSLLDNIGALRQVLALIIADWGDLEQCDSEFH